MQGTENLGNTVWICPQSVQGTERRARTEKNSNALRAMHIADETGQ